MKAGTRDLFILSVLVASLLFMGAAIFQVLESPSQEHKFDDRIDKVTVEKLRTSLSVNMSKVEFDNLVSSGRPTDRQTDLSCPVLSCPEYKCFILTPTLLLGLTCCSVCFGGSLVDDLIKN